MHTTLDHFFPLDLSTDIELDWLFTEAFSSGYCLESRPSWLSIMSVSSLTLEFLEFI